MATNAQIDANRRNAQLSTGPRSAAGKSVSRFNALKHGADARALTIPGEDPAELEALAVDYHNRFQPEGPVETYMVETIVKADWDRRRYARMEAQFLRVRIAALDAPTDFPLGEVFRQDADGSRALDKLFRRQAAAERTYFRALTELRRAQEARLAEEELAAAEEAVAAEPPELASFPRSAATPVLPGPQPLAPGPQPASPHAARTAASPYDE